MGGWQKEGWRDGRGSAERGVGHASTRGVGRQAEIWAEASCQGISSLVPSVRNVAFVISFWPRSHVVSRFGAPANRPAIFDFDGGAICFVLGFANMHMY